MALVSTLVASGAYYSYRGAGERADSSSKYTTTSPTAARPTTLGPTKAETSAETTRRALILDQGHLYTGSIVGDEPLSKETDDRGRKVLEIMTPEQVNERLRRNEESWDVGRGNGVLRYDVVQIPSNDPIEDDHVEQTIEIPSGQDGSSKADWMFWGVFDGHRYLNSWYSKFSLTFFSGWTTSAKLRQALVTYVAREVNSSYTSETNNIATEGPSDKNIVDAIKRGFINLDNEIVHESIEKVMKAKSKSLAAEILAPALSGSCALLSFYDSRSQLLRVACTGDSRAVLGRRGSNGNWSATTLSTDQTGKNPDEVARLRKEHPGEDYVVANGRVLGSLEPTRAFGDASYKWTAMVQEKVKNFYFGRTASPRLRSPPYVTAEPVVTTTKIEPKNHDFVVMASDGLWEMLTNEEVVGLVGRWLDEQAAQNKKTSSQIAKSWLPSWLSAQKKLPVDHANESTGSGGQRVPIRRQQWGLKDTMDEQFVIEDNNAATHLVRNALGGKDTDQVCALLTLPSPYSRRYR